MKGQDARIKRPPAGNNVILGVAIQFSPLRWRNSGQPIHVRRHRRPGSRQAPGLEEAREVCRNLGPVSQNQRSGAVAMAGRMA